MHTSIIAIILFIIVHLIQLDFPSLTLSFIILSPTPRTSTVRFGNSTKSH